MGRLYSTSAPIHTAHGGLGVFRIDARRRWRGGLDSRLRGNDVMGAGMM